MKLESLGYKSQLIFTGFDGQFYDRGNHVAIHTLSNPNFFWGNLLIYKHPPTKDDYAIWTGAFHNEFTNPDIYHVTLGWDSQTSDKTSRNSIRSNFMDHSRRRICLS